jgi:hypothetical protein
LGGVLAKNTSLETKFPSPFGSGNVLCLDWYFSQIPLPNMIYLYNVNFGLSIFIPVDPDVLMYKVGSPFKKDISR